MASVIEKVKGTILKHNMIKTGDKIICAVSGGADSVSLLLCMLELKKEYNLEVYAINVDHKIRDEESRKDSLFVKNLCDSLNVKLFFKEIDVKSIAKEEGKGLEECAREVRYAFFDEVAKSLNGAKIATGHNLNDNAETVLFRLIRGSGIKGLCAIQYVRGNIIRPLLDIERCEIEEFLLSRNQKWCIDSTNADNTYSRNKIRLDVMPLLCEIVQNAPKKIASLSNLLTQDEDFLSQVSDEAFLKVENNGEYDKEEIQKLHGAIKSRVIIKILVNSGIKNVTQEKVDDFTKFLNLPTGKKFDIDDKYYFLMSYGKIKKIKREKEARFEFNFNIGSTIELSNCSITSKISDKAPKKNNNIAIFDMDKINDKLFVRSRKDGDKIEVLGMKGTKKLKDLFIDLKIPQEERENVPVILCGDTIIFVPPYRQSQVFYPDNNTKQYLVIECKNSRE